MLVRAHRGRFKVGSGWGPPPFPPLFKSERWLSGRKRLIRNQVWAQVQRGFDSHPLLDKTGTLKGFLRPPAMGSAEQSSSAPDAIDPEP